MTKALPLDRSREAPLSLRFSHHDKIAHVDDPIWQDVSSLAVAGRTLFCTCDETASVESLTWDPDANRAGDHESFPLGLIFDLPAGATGEMDIEGLSVADGWLWICGSHGLKRGKPRKKLGNLGKLKWDPNRGFLGRIPLEPRDGDRWEPVRYSPAAEGRPARRAAMLPMTKGPKTPLRKMLAKDPLIGPFMDLPCKENGFDVEGLAAHEDEVVLGLRGPVLRGWAILVRMKMKTTKQGFLKPRKLPNGKRYSLHIVDLDGQGVRDLVWDRGARSGAKSADKAGRLLLLSGAIADHPAPQSVYALAASDLERDLILGHRLPRLLDLPVKRDGDNAEGLDILTRPDGARRLTLVYDAPHAERTDPEEGELIADLFALDP